MNHLAVQPDYLETYYCAYIGACAVLIAGLGWTFHRAGQIFLKDAFAGNITLVRAVSRLLDLGFYLLSTGYVGLSCATDWPMIDHVTVAKIAIRKAGGLLLVVGAGHIFNLLVLALLRQRRAPSFDRAAGA